MEFKDLLEGFILFNGTVGMAIMCFRTAVLKKERNEYFKNWERVTDKYDKLLLRIAKGEFTK